MDDPGWHLFHLSSVCSTEGKQFVRRRVTVTTSTARQVQSLSSLRLDLRVVIWISKTAIGTIGSIEFGSSLVTVISLGRKSN